MIDYENLPDTEEFGASGCSTWYLAGDDDDSDGSASGRYASGDEQESYPNTPALALICWIILGGLVSLLVGGLYYYWPGNNIEFLKMEWFQ